MKNIVLLALTAVLAFGCKGKKKETATKKETLYIVDAQRSSVHWTGYKFTEKKGVKGTFTTINITKQNPSKTEGVAALNGVAFEIPVSSLFSNDETGTRDPKLKSLFFGVMENTTLLKGTFHITDETNGYIDLTMNGVTEKQPFTYHQQSKGIKLKGTLDLKKWNTAKALESIHKACELLHTGTDGISKTWDEVGLEAMIYFTKKK